MRRPVIETGGDARRAVEVLASNFGIPLPLIVPGRGRTSSFSRPKEGRPARLILSVSDWHGLEAATLHEVAHLVAYYRADGVPDAHGEVFFHALREIAAFWLGDARTYPWESEYETIYHRAVRLGLTKKAPVRNAGAAAPASSWAVGEPVEFRTRRHELVSGILALAKPTQRAIVREHGTGRQWRVPWALLKRVKGASDAIRG